MPQGIGDAPVPNGGSNCVGDCANVSIAYDLRTRDEEFYLGYIGGQKGT